MAKFLCFKEPRILSKQAPTLPLPPSGYVTTVQPVTLCGCGSPSADTSWLLSSEGRGAAQDARLRERRASHFSSRSTFRLTPLSLPIMC